MKRLTRLLVWLALPLALAACARHVVVDRNFGRVDSQRSITTNSDLQWQVIHPPKPADVAK